jgi:hypothetical protein
MAPNTERQSFRGVVCLHCKTAIPVPTIVRDIHTALQKEVGAFGKNSSVFNLRCPLCHKEKPYRIGEIVDFEGLPEPVSPFAQPTSVGRFPQGGITNSAKA